MFEHASARFVSLGASVGVSLLVGGALVWHLSYSAFSSVTVDPTSSFTAGSVVLSDDDSSTVMFIASGLRPGSTGTKCIVVTSTGALASTVKLYATGYTTVKALGTHLDMVIDEGTGGSFSASGPTTCTGFVAEGNQFTGTLAAFAATKTDFATGVSSWAPAGAGSPTKTFRLTYTLDAATPNSSQSGTAAVGLTWEAQNS